MYRVTGLEPVGDQNAFGLVEVALCSLVGLFTGERYQSTLGFSLRPVARVRSLRHTLPVRLDTSTARAACVKFSLAFNDAVYRSCLVRHISPRVGYDTPSNIQRPSAARLVSSPT